MALDPAAPLDGFGGASEADPAGRTGMRPAIRHYIDAPAKTGESTDKWMISMSFRKPSLIAMSEAALIAAGGGLAAWYSPQLDLPAIVGVVPLPDFVVGPNRSLRFSRLA